MRVDTTMNDQECALAKVVLEASACPEHAKESCLYGCSHSRRDECEACALLAARAVEQFLLKREGEKWVQALRSHQASCPNMSGECVKEILNERLSIMLKENPNLPVVQWP